MASEYTSFKKKYEYENNVGSSALFSFVSFLCLGASIFIVYVIGSNTEWIDSLAETLGIGWGWVAFGMWFVLFFVFAGLSGNFLASHEIEWRKGEIERRRKLIACPKCGEETKIVKDDLFSEGVISERKKDSNNKIIVFHYRVGTRLVTIACQSCDYTKGYELKFKERT